MNADEARLEWECDSRGMGVRVENEPRLRFTTWWRIERHIEIVDAFEIAEVIVVGLMHQFGIHHRKNDAAKIIGAMDSPMEQDRFAIIP